MPHHLLSSSLLEARKILSLSVASNPALQTHKGKLSLDSIASCTPSSLEETASQLNVASRERVSLPKPKSNVSADELAVLAEAFCKAFNAIDQGISAQTQDYTQLQELAQTQSQGVLASTTNAINQEEATVKLSAQIAGYESSMGQTESDLNYTTLGIGIAIFVASIIAGFLTGGATDVAVPEELEGIEMDELSIEGDPETSDLEEVESLSENPEVDEVTQEVSEQNTGKTDENDLTKVTDESSKSTSSYLKEAGKILLKLGAGAALSSPMLMTAITNFYLSDQLSQLSNTQKTTGDAMNTMHVISADFDFSENVIRREGSNETEEIDGASQIIEVFSDIASAYRQITYGLANAV